MKDERQRAKFIGCFKLCRVEFILESIKNIFSLSILSLINLLILTRCWNISAWKKTWARLSYTNEYSGSWWLGGACHQAISSHSFGPMLPEYSSLCTITVIFTSFAFWLTRIHACWCTWGTIRTTPWKIFNVTTAIFIQRYANLSIRNPLSSN